MRSRLLTEIRLHLHMKEHSKAHSTASDLAEMAMMLAMIETVKRALDFLPNIELVTFLFLVFTLLRGKRVILVSFAFTAAETFVFGSGLWVIMYLYMWPLEIVLVLLLRRKFPRPADGFWWYCILAGVFGLFFGAFCSIPYWILSGPKVAIAWWIAGIPMDILHCVSNFTLCFLLFRPVMYAAGKVLAARD